MGPDQVNILASAAVADLELQGVHVWAGRATRQDLAAVTEKVERLWRERTPLVSATESTAYFAGLVFASGERCRENAGRAAALLLRVMSQGDDAVAAHLVRWTPAAPGPAPA